MALMRLESSCWWNHYHHGRVKSPTARPYSRFRHGERFGEGATATAWPIPIYWLEQVQTKEYWEFIGMHIFEHSNSLFLKSASIDTFQMAQKLPRHL
jgi:hypothetical protein